MTWAGSTFRGEGEREESRTVLRWSLGGQVAKNPVPWGRGQGIGGVRFEAY